MTINITYPQKISLFGTNAYWSGKHWARRKQDAEYWHWLVRAATPDAEMISGPVRITFYFNDALDLDNHSMIVKMIIDGLKGRVIKDDNRKNITEIAYRFHDENVIRVVIERIGD